MRQEGDKMIPVDANTTKFVFDMTYRTKPAFMGGMMKKSFKKLIQDYAIAIEHHVTTGENVNKDNFKQCFRSSSATRILLLFSIPAKISWKHGGEHKNR